MNSGGGSMGGGCVGVAMYGAVGIDLSSGCLRVILVLVPLYAQCTYQDIKWFAICWNFSSSCGIRVNHKSFKQSEKN